MRAGARRRDRHKKLCDGKRIYKTRVDADNAAAANFKLFGKVGMPYECAVCDGWHLTYRRRYAKARP